MAAMEEKIVAQRKKKAGAPKKATPPSSGMSSAMAKLINRVGGTASTRGDYAQTGGFKAQAQEAERAGQAAGLKDITSSMSGVGGAGGPSGPSAADRYVQAIQKMLTGGAFRRPQDELMGRLNDMYGTAQTGVNTAMDTLQASLQGQANPFAGFQAQTAQVSPQLTEFLQSQGASADPLAQLAAVRQQEATNQAGAFQNVANTLSQIYGANQQGAVGDVAQQRANFLSGLEGARAGYGTKIESQATDQQNKLLQLLLQGISKGGRPRRGRLV